MKIRLRKTTRDSIKQLRGAMNSLSSDVEEFCIDHDGEKFLDPQDLDAMLDQLTDLHCLAEDVDLYLRQIYNDLEESWEDLQPEKKK